VPVNGAGLDEVQPLACCTRWRSSGRWPSSRLRPVDVSRTDWRKALINLVLMSASTFLVAIVIEEDARADGSAATEWE
jgi:hypothetical protein